MTINDAGARSAEAAAIRAEIAELTEMLAMIDRGSAEPGDPGPEVTFGHDAGTYLPGKAPRGA